MIVIRGDVSKMFLFVIRWSSSSNRMPHPSTKFTSAIGGQTKGIYIHFILVLCKMQSAYLFFDNLIRGQ